MNHTDATSDMEPAAGYLDDEFARFRAERLARRAASKAAAAAIAPPGEASPEAEPEAEPEAPAVAAPPVAAAVAAPRVAAPRVAAPRVAAPPVAAQPTAGEPAPEAVPAPALPDAGPAAPVAAAAPEGPEPPDGYLEDEFARFRAERLRSSGRLSTRLAREAAAAPTAPTQEGEELFFGTTSVDRRRNKDRTEEAREDISDLPVARTGQAQAADHQPGPGAPRRRVG